MNKVNLSWPIIGVAVLFTIGIAVMVSDAQTQTRQNPESSETTRAAWEYARLIISDDVAAFQAGETNVEPEALSLDTLYRRLGGGFRPNLTNLLNQIGSQGWELVTTDESVWTFKRRR